MHGTRLRLLWLPWAWVSVVLTASTFQAVFSRESRAAGVKIAQGTGVGNPVVFDGLGVHLDRPTIPAQGLEMSEPQTKAPDTPTQALFEQGRRLLYNSTTMEEFSKAGTLLEQAKGSLKALTENDPNNPLNFYWLAQAEFELGEWYAAEIQEIGRKADRRKAEEQFKLAWKVAEHSVQLDKGFSDSHRLVGETIMRLIGFKGWRFAAANNSKAQQEIKRAIQLAPKNAQVHKALGLWYFFTPRMFGGNLNKAISSLQQAKQLATDDHVSFLANMWLGQAFLKKKDKPKAKSHFQKALEIYPNSGWGKSLLARAQP